MFLYSSDRFQKPYPFEADIAVSIDDVLEQKILAVSKLESQVFEGGANGNPELVDSIPRATDAAGRLEWIRQRWSQRQANEADTYRKTLIRWYGDRRDRP